LVTRVAGLWRGLHRPAKGLRVLPVGKPAIREAMACRISLQIAHEGVEPLADCLMHCGVWLGLTRLKLHTTTFSSALPAVCLLRRPLPWCSIRSTPLYGALLPKLSASAPATSSASTSALCAVHQYRLDDCVDAVSLQTFSASVASQSPQPQPPQIQADVKTFSPHSSSSPSCSGGINDVLW